MRPAHLDIRVDTADRSENTFKEIFEPYPTLEQLDVRFQYYDDCLARGYFDFTAHPETGISIHMVVSDVDLYIEDPVSRKPSYRGVAPFPLIHLHRAGRMGDDRRESEGNLRRRLFQARRSSRRRVRYARHLAPSARPEGRRARPQSSEKRPW